MEVPESNKMTRLSKQQIANKLKFINKYLSAENAASGSTFDPNSNVTHKNVGTLMAELNKDINIQIKRALVCKYITKEFGEDTANLYIHQLENHEIYCHDETASVLPYCVAVSLSPFIENGLKMFGGETKPPKHLSSYNGGLINLVFALTSQFAGAVAIVEYLLYFNYYAIKDYGENYLDTHKEIVQQELQQFVYAINQPAAARGMQSAFTNISIFDKYYFSSLFQYTTYPDGSRPKWEHIDKLQRFFLRWFNQERKKALLTFPVVTVAILTTDREDGSVIVADREYYEFIAKEISEGNAFFIYMSDTVDSLSSCCRLRNNIQEQLNDFQYSLGAGGIMTGSINVITLNMNRFVQEHYNNGSDFFLYQLKNQVSLIQKYQVGFRRMFEYFYKADMLPVYTAHFIELDKQYCTIGINGLVEAAEYLGLEIGNNEKYKNFISKVMQVFSTANKEGRMKYGIRFNTELVPAESLGVKFANWDKQSELRVPRDCYNSYLYKVEDPNITLIDKFALHGKEIMQYMDGGSALHINLENYPTEGTAKKILNIAAESGCPYFCFNIKVTICNDCGYIDKHTLTRCSKCNSSNIDYATRAIGYLKRINNFSVERQQEAERRYYGRT